MKAKKDIQSTSSVSPTKELFDNQQLSDMSYQVPSYEHGMSMAGYKQTNFNYSEHSNGYSVTDPHWLQYNNYKV